MKLQSWKLCTCDEERRRICRIINMDDPAHKGPAWADIGMHPGWLVCGHAGEKPQALVRTRQRKMLTINKDIEGGNTTICNFEKTSLQL